MATYTDITDGARVDITVEFVSRRALDCQGERVTRLLVADTDGKHFAVLVTPESETYPDLETGETYRASNLLGADPVQSPATDAPECPACETPLRAGQTLDTVGVAAAGAASLLSIEDSLGIVDQQATLSRISEGSEDTVDDWQPMSSRSTRINPPEYVCDLCGRELNQHEIREPGDATHPEDHEILQSINNCTAPADANMAPKETVGVATGGAKDVTNFRENVAEGYTPQPEAISDEGLFYDYHFETGDTQAESDALFSPRYAAAVSEHPLSGDAEQYLSVGLDSTLSVEDFERPRLDLVGVLDVSGSMDSAFEAYYYDEHGRRHEAENDAETKLEAATRSLCALTEQLHPEDRLGVVLFNSRAHVAKRLREVGTTDMTAIRRHIREIKAGGGTNMEDGFEAALDMLVGQEPDPRTERRVVFMTDMMPNTGETGKSEFTELFADAAADGVHTTFIGMGLDANAELSDTLSGIRGANHYFIHSTSEFERRLGDEFDYMVTPLVYDLDLELETDSYEIEAVHGSPTADAGTGLLMHVGTLFPSTKEDGEARGGVVLVRLEQTDAAADLSLQASWTERNGVAYTEEVSVDMPAEPETFDHDGVRKAIALARYARQLRAWAADVHQRSDSATGVDDWLLPDQRGEHKRESVPLVVPERHGSDFQRFRAYLEAEMEELGDETLQQEIELLTTLCEEAPQTVIGGERRVDE